MGQRLLVLDADEAFIDEHRAGLELVFEADFVGSSENIVETLGGGGYAAILLSAEIDEGRGYAVCASIRNHRPLSDFKIVLISSRATESDFARHKKLRVRADQYLRKPILTDALVSELGAFVPRKASALDGTLDALMGIDIDEDWLASLGGPDPPPKESGEEESCAPRRWEDDHAAAMGRLISELRARTMELAQARRMIEDLQSAAAEAEALRGGLEADLRAKDAELLAARQDIQELQRKNDTITVNLEEMEERQKSLDGLHVRLQETEDQLRWLESPSRLGRYANDVLYERMHEAVAEKKALLRQLEALTQDLAEKNLQAVQLIRAREDAQQHFLEVEGRTRRLERDFESRVEGERSILFSRMEELKDSEAAARKLVSALEEACAAKAREMEAAALSHGEEKRRLLEDFEAQRQALVSSSRAQKEELLAALGAMVSMGGAGGGLGQPADRADQVDPVDQTDPLGPLDLLSPVDPVGQADPVDLANPLDPRAGEGGQ
jgi:DNA-binding response OmpR family regulator